MPRFAVLLALLVVAVPSVAAATQAQPRLRISDRSPLVVRGSGFAPGERVRVTVSGPRRLTKTVTAVRTGAILARWALPAGDKESCAALAVRAVGTRGSVAAVKVPGIECPQPPQDPGP